MPELDYLHCLRLQESWPRRDPATAGPLVLNRRTVTLRRHLCENPRAVDRSSPRGSCKLLFRSPTTVHDTASRHNHGDSAVDNSSSERRQPHPGDPFPEHSANKMWNTALNRPIVRVPGAPGRPRRSWSKCRNSRAACCSNS